MNARPPIAHGPMLVAALLLSALALPGTSKASPAPEPAADIVAGPTPTATSPQPVDPTIGLLRVKVAPAIDDASLMPTWIAERNPTVEQSLVLPEHEQWIEVEIGGATYAYQVAVTLMRDGAPVATGVETVSCECNSQELLELVDQQITKTVQQAKAVEPEETETPIEPKPPIEPEPPPEPSKRLGPLGIGGIVTGAVGVGVLAGGVAMVVIHERPIDDVVNQHFTRDYRPLGYATLSMGATALIAGTTMLALDLTRCRRQPDANGCTGTNVESPATASFRHPRISAILAPGTTGISIHGRF